MVATVGGWAGTAAAQTPPTTVDPVQDLLHKLLGATTTVPAPGPAPAPPAPPGPAPAPAAAKGGPTTTAKPGVVPRVVPADAQAMINSIKRTGGRNTSALMTSLHQLVDLGLSPEEAVVIGMGHFPVGGEAAYNDDFLMPRFTGTFHLHQGNDIFAARGTPVRAPNDGSVRFGADPLGGNAAYVTQADGTYYYMCHLASYAKIPSGSRVTQGQIVGYVGDTGDAAGTPHLHFEVHPRGGAATNPKPILDRWLDEAKANVVNILASYQVGVPRAVVDTGRLRRFDQGLNATSDGDVFLSASSTGSGSRRLTELRSQAGDQTQADAAAAEAWRAAEQTAKEVLAPVTPPLMQFAVVGDAS
jgi:murein DD-endopeptidase MepM/ murein hydrolase activator NlpD